MWLSLFNEAAEKIIAQKADNIMQLKEHDDAAYQAAMLEMQFKRFKFKVKAASRTWNDESKVDCSCVEVDEIDYAAEMKLLIETIDRY